MFLGTDSLLRHTSAKGEDGLSTPSPTTDMRCTLK